MNGIINKERKNFLYKTSYRNLFSSYARIDNNQPKRTKAPSVKKPKLNFTLDGILYNSTKPIVILSYKSEKYFVHQGDTISFRGTGVNSINNLVIKEIYPDSVIVLNNNKQHVLLF